MHSQLLGSLEPELEWNSDQKRKEKPRETLMPAMAILEHIHSIEPIWKLGIIICEYNHHRHSINSQLMAQG